MFLRLEAFLPDGFDTVAEIVEDTTALSATACREKTADDASNMATDIEVLWVVDTNTLYTKTETADSWKDNGLSF